MSDRKRSPTRLLDVAMPHEERGGTVVPFFQEVTSHAKEGCPQPAPATVQFLRGQKKLDVFSDAANLLNILCRNHVRWFERFCGMRLASPQREGWGQRCRRRQPSPGKMSPAGGACFPCDRGVGRSGGVVCLAAPCRSCTLAPSFAIRAVWSCTACRPHRRTPRRDTRIPRPRVPVLSSPALGAASRSQRLLASRRRLAG
jgi:hypothetical protein